MYILPNPDKIETLFGQKYYRVYNVRLFYVFIYININLQNPNHANPTLFSSLYLLDIYI